MTEVLATTPGLFPLPDRAKSALADLKGHQKDDLIDGDETGELLEVYDRARRDVIESQTAAGLDRIVDGPIQIVLELRDDVDAELVDGRQVIPLDETVEFANEHYATFQSALDMLDRMYDEVNTDADYRMESA